MKKIIRSIDKRTTLKIKNWLAFQKDKKQFAKLLAKNQQHNIAWRFSKNYPIMNEKNLTSGNAGGHYFHQDLLVARRIFQHKPKRHLDVGSQIEGFVAHVASYRKISVMDIRPQKKPIPNVDFIQRDMMQPVKKNSISEKEKFDSLSCLHTLEHFGLGRYGDRIDPMGDKKGMINLIALLKKNGYLYFSVPIGKQRIMYNAHRIYAIAYLLDWFKDLKLRVIEFSYIDDDDNLYENQLLSEEKIANNYGVKNYGCAIFQLQKTT
ncbi:MAG: DUF268 domain-containing protein [Alphaproteobacteria bacterium]